MARVHVHMAECFGTPKDAALGGGVFGRRSGYGDQALMNSAVREAPLALPPQGDSEKWAVCSLELGTLTFNFQPPQL